MADSDNTTALPFVICEGRKKQRPWSGASEKAKPVSQVTPNDSDSLQGDPVLAILNDWRRLHREALVFCRLQQRQETRMEQASGSHSVSAAVPKSHLIEPSHGPSETPAGDAGRSRNRPDVALEHLRLRAAEVEAIDAEDALLDKLGETQATSIEGALAKLEMIAGGSESRAEGNSFPWRQIKSLYADVQALLARSAESTAFDKDYVDGPGFPGDGRSKTPGARVSDHD